MSQRHLLCITGLTPQVVTETLYALCREGADQLPTHLHVLSTVDGIQRARLMLLSANPGWFRRLCQDYQFPPIHFDESALHILKTASGEDLVDIRSGHDNMAAADMVMEWVRRLTQHDSDSLHVSIAGGRKTLGFFAGYALSLFGRPQDRLTHVLVQSPFESHPGFFYPTPYSEVIYAAPPDPRPLDCRDARVSLADIPFVRLREGLPRSLLTGQSSYSATVALAQECLGPVSLVLDPANCRLSLGGRSAVFPPAEFAFYLWMANRILQDLPPMACPSEGVPSLDYAEGFMEAYRAITSDSHHDERVVQGLRAGMDKNYFERRKSRVNHLLNRHFGHLAASVLIQGFGRRPRMTFGLGLEKHQIRLLVPE